MKNIRFEKLVPLHCPSCGKPLSGATPVEAEPPFYTVGCNDCGATYKIQPD